MAKQQVRSETDLFLNDVPGSNSFQAQNLGDTPDLEAIQGALARDPSLTGAANPILPMTVAIGSQSGERLEFTLLMNPENLNNGRTQSVTMSYTRSGYITQLWGPGQAILTGNGKTAVFMAPPVGLTNYFKKATFSFLNFMSLVSAYRNNGYLIYDPVQDRETAKLLSTRVIHVVTGVEITYDGNQYMGHFNNFTLDESEEMPFIFNYNFEFVASTTSFDFSDVRGHFVPLPRSRNNFQRTTPQILADLKREQ